MNFIEWSFCCCRYGVVILDAARQQGLCLLVRPISNLLVFVDIQRNGANATCVFRLLALDVLGVCLLLSIYDLAILDFL